MTDKRLVDTCGGIAEYSNIDPIIIQFIWEVTSIFAFEGVIAYVACAFIIPEKTDIDIVEAE